MYMTKPGRVLEVSLHWRHSRLTEKDPCNKDMCVVSILAALPDVGEREEIQLSLPTSACCVHRKQDGEGATASHEANDHEHLEKPEIEISIQRLVIEDILVRDTSERFQPVEFPVRKLCRLLSVQDARQRPHKTQLQRCTHSSYSVPKNVRGRYTRSYFDRRVRNSATKTAASAATGIKVATMADTDDEVPVWELDPEEDWT